MFVISFLIIRRTLNPRNNSVNRGYISELDSINTNLDRAQWSNHYTGRIPNYARYFMYSVFLTFFANIIFTSGNADGKTFFQSVIISWIFLIMVTSYFSHHADKFSSYCIDKNLCEIRKKLGIKQYDHELSSSNLSCNKDMTNGSDGYFTFFYNVE